MDTLEITPAMESKLADFKSSSAMEGIKKSALASFLDTVDSNWSIILLEACTNTRAYGITKIVSDKFPYADLLGKRTKLTYVAARAHWDSRGTPGTVKLFMEDGKPNILYMLHAYGAGKSIEDNTFKKEVMRKTTDYSYANGLRDDTSIGRLVNFSKCLQLIKAYIGEQEKKHKFVFILPCEESVPHHVCSPEYVKKIKEEIIESFNERDIQIQFKPAIADTHESDKVFDI